MPGQGLLPASFKSAPGVPGTGAGGGSDPYHLRPQLEMAAAAAAAGLLPPLPPPPPHPRFPSLPPGSDLDPFSLQRKIQEQQQQRLGLQAAMAAAAAAGGGAASPGGGLGQNIYEVAALTQELDTMQLTTRIRERLAANNICQKVRESVCRRFDVLAVS